MHIYPALIYFALFAALVSFAASIWVIMTVPPTYQHDRYGSLVVSIMILLNIGASLVRGPKLVRASLQVLSYIWIIFGFLYLFHISHILYK